jgi:hypothetical protein
MLTKIGVAALLGTIGTAALGGTAKADEPCRDEVTVAAPAPMPVGYYGTPGVYYRDGYHRDGYDRREDFARRREFEWQRERREAAFRHAEWLRHHRGFDRDRW